MAVRNNMFTRRFASSGTGNKNPAATQAHGAPTIDPFDVDQHGAPAINSAPLAYEDATPNQITQHYLDQAQVIRDGSGQSNQSTGYDPNSGVTGYGSNANNAQQPILNNTNNGVQPMTVTNTTSRNNTPGPGATHAPSSSAVTNAVSDVSNQVSVAQARDDLDTFRGLSQTQRYQFIQGLPAERRTALSSSMTYNEHNWLRANGFDLDSSGAMTPASSSGAAEDAIVAAGGPSGTGTASAATPQATGTGDVSTTPNTTGTSTDSGTTATTDTDSGGTIISDFIGMSDSDQQAYLDGLTTDEFNDIYSTLTPSQKSWFDAQGFDSPGDGSGTTGEGADDAYYTSDTEATPTVNTAQELWTEYFGSAIESQDADVIDWLQNIIDTEGEQAARQAITNSAQYADYYNNERVDAEDWLDSPALGTPHEYLTWMNTYDPSGIGDTSSQGEFFQQYKDQIAPAINGLHTGDGERFSFDASAIMNMNPGSPAQAAYVASHQNWVDLLQQATEVAESNMSGVLNEDVKRQIMIRAAEGTLQKGFGFSQAAVNYALRDLGLTSVDVQTLGVQQANAIAASYEQKREADLQFNVENAKLKEAGRQFNANFELDKGKLGLLAAEFNESIRQFNEAILEQQYEYNRSTDVTLLNLSIQSRQFNQNLLEMQQEFGSQMSVDIAKTVTGIAQFNASFLQAASQFDATNNLQWADYQLQVDTTNMQQDFNYASLNESAWNNRAQLIEGMAKITSNMYLGMASLMEQASYHNVEVQAITDSLLSGLEAITAQTNDFYSTYQPITGIYG